jgi:Cu(I)/Ag(I) efflux system membrane protein CusA/SilA
VVLGAQRTLAELRSIQDWIVRYNLVTAKGVAEVASVGGFERQYQVVVDPRKLQAFGIPLDRVSDAIRASNSDVGGRTIEMSETELMTAPSPSVSAWTCVPAFCPSRSCRRSRP